MAGILSLLIETSKWRAGDLVDVRPLDEILKSLNGKGCLESLPFMPEMIPYCGRRLRIVKVAHKTCDPSGSTKMRRMKNAVHLETRCDGSHHGGCQAGCVFFWKTAWLKKAIHGTRPDDGRADIGAAPLASQPPQKICDKAALDLATRASSENEEETIYRCQITEILEATSALSSIEPLQYVQDIVSRNVRFKDLVRCVALEVMRTAKMSLMRMIKAMTSFLDRQRDGIPEIAIDPTPKGERSGALALQAGERVRILPKEQIVATLNKNWRHYGLTFDSDMRRYCGGVFRVLRRVDRIIDEKTKKMRHISTDCLILDGVICSGFYCHNKLFCPRSAYSFWREAWLERVDKDEQKKDSGVK